MLQHERGRAVHAEQVLEAHISGQRPVPTPPHSSSAGSPRSPRDALPGRLKILNPLERIEIEHERFVEAHSEGTPAAAFEYNRTVQHYSAEILWELTCPPECNMCKQWEKGHAKQPSLPRPTRQSLILGLRPHFRHGRVRSRSLVVPRASPGRLPGQYCLPPQSLAHSARSVDMRE